MHWFTRAMAASFVSALPFVLLCFVLSSSLLASGILGCLVMVSSFLAVLMYHDPVTTHQPETRCRKCGYILRGISEPRCPECGERICRSP